MAGIERNERQMTPEEIAAQHVEGYIDRIEKKVEVTDDTVGIKPAGGDVQMPQQITDDQGQVVASAVPDMPEIDLPLTESQVREGLHHKLFDSFRWLAEFCVYLIKKYPGRVFYKGDQPQG